jgi:hypothetical protein
MYDEKMKALLVSMQARGRAFDETVSRFLYKTYHDHVGSEALLKILEYTGYGYVWLVPSLCCSVILLLSQPREDEALELLVNFVGGLLMDLGWVACLKPVIGCPSPVIADEYHEDRRPLIARQDRSQDAHGKCCVP